MKRLAGLWIAASLVVSSCGQTKLNANCVPGFQPTNWAALSQRTQAAKTVWEREKPIYYRYDLQPTGFAPPTVTTIGVQSGNVVEVTVVSSGQPPQQLTPDQFSLFRTIDGLFEDLETSISNHVDYGGCYGLEATFDANLGYPTSREGGIYDNRIADAMGGYRVTNFTVVATAPQP